MEKINRVQNAGTVLCFFMTNDTDGIIINDTDEENLNSIYGNESQEINNTPPILFPVLTEHIVQGYVIEAALGIIALVHPDLGWNEENAEEFTAKFDEDGT